MSSIKKAFAGIQAEEELKKNTLLFLQKARQANSKPRRQTSFIRYAALTACLAIVAFVGLFSYNLYFTPSGYIGMDVNPSIELTVNRFERVINARAFNAEGEAVLSNLSLRNKRYDEAATLIMSEITDLGYWREDGLVSITVQTDDPNREGAMLAAMGSSVNSHMETHHWAGQVDVFSVDSDMLEHAHAEDMSVAKYLAILELQEVDPTASMDRCRGHSVGEIRQMTQEHGGRHHGDNNGNGAEDDVPGAMPDNTEEPDNDNTSHNGGHGGHGKNGRHE